MQNEGCSWASAVESIKPKLPNEPMTAPVPVAAQPTSSFLDAAFCRTVG